MPGIDIHIVMSHAGMCACRHIKTHPCIYVVDDMGDICETMGTSLRLWVHVKCKCDAMKQWAEILLGEKTHLGNY